MAENIEFIKKGNDLLAVIIRRKYTKNGAEFFTPKEFPQQIGFISKQKGEIIPNHTHKLIKREIKLTQEVLVIRNGEIEVTLYDKNKKYFTSRVLEKGDVILLTGGGHGYKALKNTEMVEIKQGPYLGKNDKVIFEQG
jgi:hypothetical protein